MAIPAIRHLFRSIPYVFSKIAGVNILLWKEILLFADLAKVGRRRRRGRRLEPCRILIYPPGPPEIFEPPVVLLEVKILLQVAASRQGAILRGGVKLNSIAWVPLCRRSAAQVCPPGTSWRRRP
jgi:hypothetical protein